MISPIKVVYSEKFGIRLVLLFVVGGLVISSSLWPISYEKILGANSSHEISNKALLADFYEEVYDNYNISALDKYLDINFTSATGADKELFKEITNKSQGSFPNSTRTLINILADGDLVAVFNSWNATFSGDNFMGAPANGNQFTTATVDLFRLGDGKITEHWQIGDYSNFTKAVYG